MLTAVLISMTIGVVASRLGGIASIASISALTLLSAYFGALAGDVDAMRAIGAAVIAVLTMQAGYVGGLVLLAWQRPVAGSRVS